MTGAGWRLTASIALTGAALGVACSNVPLGWPGEWVWNRARPPAALHCVPAALGLALFGWFACRGRRALANGGRPAPWLAGLLLAGGATQALLLAAPAPGFGIERWPLALQGEHTSGYFSRARQLADAGTSIDGFARGYLEWVGGQDNFHMGTHPPGLIAVSWAAVELCRAQPGCAAAALSACPERFRAGLTLLPPDFSAADRAALALVGFGTWLAVLLTALPVYALVRWRGPPEDAWCAAALGLLVPAPLIFLPLGDCLYPLLAAVWVWLALAAADRRSAGGAAALGGAGRARLAFGNGVQLGVLRHHADRRRRGMAGSEERSRRARGRLWTAVAAFLFAGAGLLACASWGWGLDLPSVWRVNLEKHAGFYRHFSRSYRVWVWLDVLEFAVVVGPALFVGMVCRAARPRAAPLAAATAGTLLLLDLSGKNLSEVARLWLLLTPFAAASLGPVRPRGFAALLAAQAALALALVTRVETLLPVALP